MYARSLTPEQKSLLQEEAFTSLEFGLRQWCVEPVDYPKLMRDIELFETSRYNYRAVPIANSFQVIRWSLDDNVASLGALLEDRYRGGNIRIRISEGFINRLIPSETQATQPIEDKVLGALVEGTSDTTSRLNIKLLDDDGRWVIGLDAQGEIKSNTTSTKGAAIFENEATASFQASKKLMISPSGIEFGETLADVQSESKLVNFETDYDNSLLGGIARNMAKNQYKQKRRQLLRRWISEFGSKQRIRWTTRFQNKWENSNRPIMLAGSSQCRTLICVRLLLSYIRLAINWQSIID